MINTNFALYHLPGSDVCNLIMQMDGDVEELGSLSEIAGRRGFLMAPFSADKNHPIILLHPDIKVIGIENIVTFLGDMERAEIEPQGGEAKSDYRECYRIFMDAIVKKQFSKLVLSRCATFRVGDNFSPIDLFTEACNSYPHAFVYLCHTTKSGMWLGSTPEVLISGHGDKWQTVAMAGTMGVKEYSYRPKWNDKNIEEHRYVSDYIRHIISGLKEVDAIEESELYTSKAGDLVHLKMDFNVKTVSDDCVGRLLESLYPTPAICGLPKEEAKAFIVANEGYDREYYSGVVGWVDVENETNLYVNLRCMQVGCRNVRLYAGGGIIASSILEEEWGETEQKLATMLKIVEK